MNRFKNLRTMFFVSIMAIMPNTTHASAQMQRPMSDEDFDLWLDNFGRYKEEISRIVDTHLKPFIAVSKNPEVAAAYAYFTTKNNIETIFTEKNPLRFAQNQIAIGLDSLRILHEEYEEETNAIKVFHETAIDDLKHDLSLPGLPEEEIAEFKEDLQTKELESDNDLYLIRERFSPIEFSLLSLLIKSSKNLPLRDDCVSAEDYLNLKNLLENLINYNEKNGSNADTINATLDLPFLWKMSPEGFGKQFFINGDLNTQPKRNALIGKITLTMERIHHAAQQDAFEQLSHVVQAITELIKNRNAKQIDEHIQSLSIPTADSLRNPLFSFYARYFYTDQHLSRAILPNIYANPLYHLLTVEQKTTLTNLLLNACLTQLTKPSLYINPRTKVDYDNALPNIPFPDARLQNRYAERPPINVNVDREFAHFSPEFLTKWLVIHKPIDTEKIVKSLQFTEDLPLYSSELLQRNLGIAFNQYHRMTTKPLLPPKPVIAPKPKPVVKEIPKPNPVPTPDPVMPSAKKTKPIRRTTPYNMAITPPHSDSDTEDESSKNRVPAQAQEFSRPGKLNLDKFKVFGAPKTTSVPASKLVVPTISAKPATPVEEEETVTVLPSMKDRLKIFNIPAVTARPQPIVKPVPVVSTQAQQAPVQTSSKPGKLNLDRFKAFGVPKTDMSGADQ